MIDVSRTASRPQTPECMHCLSNVAVHYEIIWDWWICLLCGDRWDPYWRTATNAARGAKGERT